MKHARPIPPGCNRQLPTPADLQFHRTVATLVESVVAELGDEWEKFRPIASRLGATHSQAQCVSSRLAEDRRVETMTMRGHVYVRRSLSR